MESPPHLGEEKRQKLSEILLQLRKIFFCKTVIKSDIIVSRNSSPVMQIYLQINILFPALTLSSDQASSYFMPYLRVWESFEQGYGCLIDSLISERDTTLLCGI